MFLAKRTKEKPAEDCSRAGSGLGEVRCLSPPCEPYHKRQKGKEARPCTPERRRENAHHDERDTEFDEGRGYGETQCGDPEHEDLSIVELKNPPRTSPGRASGGMGCYGEAFLVSLVGVSCPFGRSNPALHALPGLQTVFRFRCEGGQRKPLVVLAERIDDLLFALRADQLLVKERSVSLSPRSAPHVAEADLAFPATRRAARFERSQNRHWFVVSQGLGRRHIIRY
jgi:hypothetical protein